MSTPLDTLIELARDARDQALQHLASARRDERQVADQLTSLEHYRQEYAERLHQDMRRGIDPATLHNTQRFLMSLDDALARARGALQRERDKVTSSQQEWQQEQQRLSAYDTLAQRRAQQGLRHQARQEQRVSDDLINSRLQRGNAIPGGY
ncbi:flagellar export protein FliJ [Halomonas denitrificans]|uniref:flagellar export protein FliJ n=1 Tax=Halomonas TaxID=2745 RepID=UPI001A8CC35E|nr:MULTISPECIES: flagellar export protein FliJ [Halomonas]MED5295180.1 flagellar export protein FliJ [Pseudomonadota bacterium]MBN8413708.1 flagellar export protein FliJ [Halomonas litopenaei]MBY5928677.1 flagellar export protein FliJ [Halomonas sp. DP8Y7-3]MBY5967844.1 flagellar export protein FliJ [Halomonas denitrificans]MBY5983346.1 flagellar export protein FliJ [Halomonas sp. DP5Y7-2]